MQFFWFFNDFIYLFVSCSSKFFRNNSYLLREFHIIFLIIVVSLLVTNYLENPFEAQLIFHKT